MSAIDHALDELEHHHGQAISATEARAELTALLKTISWVRQTVHQAHHQGEIESCSINTCKAAQKALSGLSEAGPPYVFTWHAGGCVACGVADRGPKRDGANFYFCDPCSNPERIIKPWMDACDAVKGGAA